MKKFSFTLQSVHNLREQALRATETAYGQANGAVLAAEAGLRDARAQYEQAHQSYLALLSGDMNPHEIALHISYMKAVEERISQAQQQLHERRQEREAVRLKLLEASIAAEATARLRELQFARHRAELEREEQNQLDELSAMTAARSRIE